MVFCVFLEAFAMDIKKCMANLSEFTITIDGKLSLKDYTKLRQRFSNIIQFHSNAKELV